jgi:hypothetical protein
VPLGVGSTLWGLRAPIHLCSTGDERGRIFNRHSGSPSEQLHERRDASDFYTKTQDKARSRELTVLPRTNNNLDRLNIERSSTMPLDAAVASETLTTTLHYLVRGAEKPAA